ncbi:MAG: hypothetical protein Q8N03_12890 [Ignavibacteria bacterium]|nr:hypothetical protein [Ignavibacteria bacterium]
MTLFNCEKRNDRHFVKDKKLNRFETDFLHYKKDNITAPVMINKPNIVAIYLSIADKAFAEASHIYNNTIIPNLQYDSSKNIYTLNITNADDEVLNLFEQIFISLIFSYTAVEAFINSLIPPDFTISKKIKGKDKVYDCDEIQRHLSLEDKIKKVIPNALKIKLELETTWQSFYILKTHRDSLIHLKKETFKDLKSTQLDFIQSLVGDILTKDIIESARTLINHISKKIGNHPSIPYEFCSDPIELKNLLNRS